MSNAQDRGWGDPDSPGYQRKNIVKLKAGGVSVNIHRRLETVFKTFLDELAKHYDLAGYKDDWGYNNRDVRGKPGVKSNHAWGLAIDLNSSVNPMTTNPNAKHEFMKAVIAPMLAKYHNHLTWGGDYKRRKDYMHFEWMGTPADADKVTAELKNAKPVTPAPKPKPPVKNPYPAKSMKWVQWALGFSAKNTDGVWGPSTEAALKKFQKEKNLVPDGKLGPKSYSALSKVTRPY